MKNIDISPTMKMMKIKSKKRIRVFLLVVDILLFLYMMAMIFWPYIPFLGD